MASIRFFTDEDVYSAIATQLQAAGFDAVSTPGVNRLGALDVCQLAWAAQEDRALVTFNVAHFAQLYYQWMASLRHHAGVIVSRQRPIGDIMRRLLRLGNTHTAADMQDRLEYLHNW
ncbi:MAG TPA: DUF5615 family PIN-like protein [Candidatus Tectomicrobia bacterium]